MDYCKQSQHDQATHYLDSHKLVYTGSYLNLSRAQDYLNVIVIVFCLYLCFIDAILGDNKEFMFHTHFMVS